MKRFISSRQLRKMSLFAAGCALVAVGYIGYRVYLVAGPKGLQGILSNRTVVAASIGCNHDDNLTSAINTDKIPLVSSTYQEMVRKTAKLTKNLVANPSLEPQDSTNQSPASFFRITEGDATDYALLRDPVSSEAYLRAVNTTAAPETELAGGWVMQMIPIQKDASYAYGFEYRSNVPVSVSLELQMPDGSMEYRMITRLNKSNDWQRFTAHFHNFKDASSYRFVVVSREAGRVDTKNYEAYRIPSGTLEQGIVSITFDDGWQSIADKALPILNAYKYPTTQYIVSDAATKNVHGYMTMDTIREMQEAGHEIASHTTKHCDLTKLSGIALESQTKDSKLELEKAGLGAITSLAYPYGQYNERVDSVASKHYAFMRSSDEGYNDRYFDNRNIRAKVVRSTTTDKEFESWLNYTQENNLWLVIVYHRVDEHGDYNVTSKQLTRQLDMIKNSKLKVLPLGETAKSLR